MDVKRLRLLREFADRGSVGAVADAMHMTPSAVSQQFKVLAREAGVELLEADGRRVRLTAAGQALVLRADEVIAAVERAQEEMATYRSGRSRVRLAMFPSGSTLLLPAVLDRAADNEIAVDASHLDVGYPDAPPALADFDVVVTHRDERTAPVASRGCASQNSCASPSMSSSPVRRLLHSVIRCRSPSLPTTTGSVSREDSLSTTCCSRSRRSQAWLRA